MSRAPIMVMAGGTGGHVFPALAVAQRLREDGWPVVWMGTGDGLEARVAPAHGFELEQVDIGGVRGKGWATRLAAPVRLLSALWQSLRIVRRRHPAAVLGMGGYASGPGGIAAWMMRRPLLIHEQNAVAGYTNRILARFARSVLSGFPEVLPGARWVGNPVRDRICALPGPDSRLGGRGGPLRLLVLGGSQGARALNQVVPLALSSMAPADRPDVRHQCGVRLHAEALDAWRASGLGIVPEPFIEDMAAAYEWADVVLCRAGALTVAELAAAGVASLLVPFPAAVDDHQTRNAAFLVTAGAAELIPQQHLQPDMLAAKLLALAADRPRVTAMARAARSVAKPDATALLAALCVAAAGGDR